jgi:ATP-dependent helicase YprA (DUF1998 family)
MNQQRSVSGQPGSRRKLWDAIDREVCQTRQDRTKIISDRDFEPPAGFNRLEPEDDLFSDRKFRYEIQELTSRVSTNDVANAKRLLGKQFYEDDAVDVALATNMISVGLDIVRLGTMFVNGQPKTTAEYIQATSRVGRDVHKPGLVITLFNIHKPRDRSHYERFPTFHRSFYRSVEATSVTPFSPRALDRAMAAALVGLCRQGFPFLTPSASAAEIDNRRSELETAAKRFAERVVEHRQIPQSEAAVSQWQEDCS